MANPRDLAEQAFTLLQNALRDSEARAAELDEQLKAKKSPKTKIEEQLDVLTHRLENAEADRLKWQREAQHLEEIAEGERAKVAQLRKKLEIAESGPDKLTKKEINFWRGKAEDIDTETRDYKSRLASLRQELTERDALIDQLRQRAGIESGASIPDSPIGAALAPHSPGDVVAVDDLRWQLEQRDQRLTELQVELNELRDRHDGAGSDFALQTQAQIETLQRQVQTLEQLLAGAQRDSVALQNELGRAHAALAEMEALQRDTQTSHDRVRAALTERDKRLIELSAALEQARQETRQREQQWIDAGTQRDAQIAALARDLDALRNRAELDRRDASEAHAERDRLRAALNDLQQRASQLDGDAAQLRSALAHREEAEQAAIAAQQSLQSALSERDQALADQKSTSSQHLAAREQRIADLERQLEQRIADLERQDERQAAEADAHVREAAKHFERLQDIERELEERSAQVAAHTERLANQEREIARHALDVTNRDHRIAADAATLTEREARIAVLAHDLEERDAQLEMLGRFVAERDEQLTSLQGEVAQVRMMVGAGEAELNSVRATLLACNSDVDQLRAQKLRIENELSGMLAQHEAARLESEHKDAENGRLAKRYAELEREYASAREQNAGLEAELKDEKEHNENLRALANDRRDVITKLQEQVEEATERYEEAKWRLGKAQVFERLVKRRKGLVAKLLAALRAKQKSNVALKAGLDGLRTYKAAAEANQQKLLQRIDGLKAEIKEAEETIARHQGATIAKEQLTVSESRSAELESRLNMQAELIQSLESDLKLARATQRSGDAQMQEMERVHQELAAKDQLITQLQADVDEQQRKLAKLRGSESETVRLKAISEKERTTIDALEREIAQLREALARQGEEDADGSAKLKERDASIARMLTTIKEHEANIKQLTESADSWKRKYQFLATDAPDAYQTVVEK
jgi:chromosome segregation ATPase